MLEERNAQEIVTGSNCVGNLAETAKVNQQPMHQLVVLSTGWAAFFHSTSDGVHHSPFLFVTDHCFFFLGLFLAVFP